MRSISSLITNDHGMLYQFKAKFDPLPNGDADVNRMPFVFYTDYASILSIPVSTGQTTVEQTLNVGQFCFLKINSAVEDLNIVQSLPTRGSNTIYLSTYISQDYYNFQFDLGETGTILITGKIKLSNLSVAPEVVNVPFCTALETQSNMGQSGMKSTRLFPMFLMDESSTFYYQTTGVSEGTIAEVMEIDLSAEMICYPTYAQTYYFGCYFPQALMPLLGNKASIANGVKDYIDAAMDKIGKEVKFYVKA